jgi:ATP-dependent RNA helicase DOB1
MSESVKRELAGLEGVSAPAAKKYKPEARLGDDRVAAMPVGSNLIEVDGKSCTHEVCWPPGVQGSSEPPKARPGAPAREYAFKLDPFQQTAINALETGEPDAACSWQWICKHDSLQGKSGS